ncbi:hypothetical protein [Sphingomonas bacterium]|uniref:hypothetical protein n=1 Tax=Sphingomonas bacterium TaxID=1895847 RepID=UPI0015754DF7|nr:hypothetical protein [Sphingomonas bacterium]
MRVFLPLMLAPMLLIAGCDVHSNADTKSGNDVHISMTKDDKGSGRMSLNIPGFDAKVSIPGFMMNGHMDIDGMKLAPDTQIRTVDVLGKDKDIDKGKAGDDHGSVHLTFTNPKDPAAVLAYYRQAAADAGYTISPISGDGGLAATKADKKFALAISPESGGSRGSIDITGE